MRYLIAVIVCLGFAPAVASAQDASPARDDLAALGESIATADAAALAAMKPAIVKRGMAAHDLLFAGVEATAGQRAAIRAELRAARDTAALASGLVLHEWGSVMSLAGHDGATIGYLGDDQSDLPDIVHTWQSILQDQPQVIRKPIIYLYAPPGTTTVNQVAIRAPQGLITQWYPKAAQVQPRFFGAIPDNVPVENGYINWGRVTIHPAESTAELPRVDKDHPWWHIVRDVDARVLTANGQSEKFLFYRGVNRVGASVHVAGSESDGAYELHNTGKHPVRGAVFMRRTHGKASFYPVPTLEPDGKHRVDLAAASALSEQDAIARFVEQLETEGLFPKEADVVRRIWSKFFFQRDGVRLLYVMPPQRVDELLQLQVNPQPASVVRTLIVQVECATDQMIQRIEKLIAQLGHSDFAIRQNAQAELERLDRFAEALLRKAVEESADLEVRQRAEAILKKMDKKKMR